jgi:hypothetical protein
MRMDIKCKFAVLLAAGAFLSGCGSGLKDVSSDPKFSGIMRHVFETRNDMIIYQLDTDTLRLELPGEAGAPTLSELPPDLPYRTRMGDIVLGVLPAGSRFQVAHIYSSWSTASGGEIRYEMRMITPKEYKGRELSDIGLLDYGVWPMSFEKKLVLEVNFASLK